MALTAQEVFRDYSTDGVPSSGVHEPKKSEIRTLLGQFEQIITAFTSNGGLIYDTRALLYADLAKDANRMAWVIGDSTAAYNGVYKKVGASGSGSWTRVADLPYSFIPASDVGAGTPNAIVATSSLPISSSALVLLNVYEANTASPVTVSFNGGTPLTIKTNSGNDVVAGGLVSGMVLLGRVSGSTFRLVSDQAAAAIVAAAEAAADRAEQAALDAENLVASLSPGGTGAELIAAATPEAARMAANVRGKVNFFDFLQTTRTPAEREQIMNGAFTGDLAVEWQAFRDALWAIYDDGGRAHGLIPECMIYTSASPNFAMDFLTLETQGRPRIRNTAGGDGFTVNGHGLGVNGYGVREMKIGTLIAETETGANGIFIREVHQSEFDPLLALGAVSHGIYVYGCVSTVFRKPSCQSQVHPFLTTPAIGLRVNGDPGAQTSWCLFDMPIFEYVPIGIQLDQALGCSFLSGTAEGNSNVGIAMGPTALLNKFIGIDFEANANFDVYCEGSRNQFIAVDSGGKSTFTTANCRLNKIVGGEWNKVEITAGAAGNVVYGINYNTGGTGYLNDGGYGNIFRDNTNALTGELHSGPQAGPGHSAPGYIPITIATEAVEDTLRTWVNPHKVPVSVLVEPSATSTFYKNVNGLRYNLGAGGHVVTVLPGDKLQIGFTTAPDVRYRYL